MRRRRGRPAPDRGGLDLDGCWRSPEELLALTSALAGWLVRKGLPREEAEEIAAEVRLAALSSGSPGRRRAWVMGAVRRRFLDRLRARYRTPDWTSLPSGPTPVDPLSACVRRETRANLRAHLRCLPRALRRAIVGAFYLGLRPRALSAIEGISRQAVEKRVQRAVECLRRRRLAAPVKPDPKEREVRP